MKNLRFISALSLTLVVLATNSVAATSATRERQRSAFLPAWAEAQGGKLTPESEAFFRHYPLLPYLQLAQLQFQLKRGTRDLEPTAVAWLKQHKDVPGSASLRENLLDQAQKRGDPQAFLRAYLESQASPKRRCQVWSIRMQLAPDQELGVAHARALVVNLDSPASECEPAFGFFNEKASDANVLWQKRFAQQLVARHISAAKTTLGYLRPSLSPEAYALLERQWLVESDAYTAIKQSVSWPLDAAHKQLVMRSLLRIAKSAPRSVASQFVKIDRFALNTADLAPVYAEQARAALINNDPDALVLFKKVPAAARDAQIGEWAARRALRALDPELALEAMQNIPEPERSSSRWRFNRARVLAWLGRDAESLPELEAAAREANFHGFLAADLLGIGYALCPESEQLDAEKAAPVTKSAALARVYEWQALQQIVPGKREWMNMLAELMPDARRQAGLIASRENWGELAILTLNQIQDRRLYKARFPLLKSDLIAENAELNGLDPALVAGLIRQESAWNPNAVSRANAIGLMQMLPATAAMTARGIGLATTNINLKHVPTNLRLGTRHLADLLRAYEASPILVTAAYNAGPNALKKWLSPLRESYPELWIETISYRETRDYVSIVLAFTVIYDWRLDGTITRLSERVPEFKNLLAPELRGKSVPQVCP